MQPMGSDKRAALTDPGQGKARTRLESQHGRGVFVQILFIAGVILGVGALILAVGMLLSDEPGQRGIAIAVLGGLALLALVWVVVRHRNRGSIDEAIRR